jgi:hypothetical protein
MDESFVCQLDDLPATERLGAQLAEAARPGDVIFLRGELGAGKTSLSRGFLRRFFADPALEVPSPSYLICFTYTDSSATAAVAPATDSATTSTGRSLRAKGTARLPGVNVLHLDPYRLPEGKVASLIDLAPAFEVRAAQPLPAPSRALAHRLSARAHTPSRRS